jgi:hypothetical protein
METLRPALSKRSYNNGDTAPNVRGYRGSFDRAQDQRGPRVAQKSKNCKTNPNLIKPAWKTVNRKAKNEPKFGGGKACFGALKGSK